MTDAGTLLSDLDGAHSSDGDLVDSILSDLNQPSHTNPIVQSRNSQGQVASIPPPAGMRLPMQPQQQGLPSTYPNAADPAVPTAHLIGRDHPTEADFQRMMMAAQGPLPFNSLQPQMQGQVVQQQGQTQEYEEPKKNWQGQWIDELKQPILVAILVFLVTLPAVNLLFSHYAPTLLRPGGDLTTVGMAVRALFGGVLYWVLQRVIAPLVSL